MIVGAAQTHFYLWDSYALYIGMGLPSTMHQHNAVQIGISLDHPFRIKSLCQSEFALYRSFVVQSNVPHEIDSADTPSIFVWIEAESLLAQTIHQIQEHPLKELPGISRFELLAATQDALLDCNQAVQLLHTIVNAIVPFDFTPRPLDERVQATLVLIQRNNPSEAPLSIPDIAQRVYLSASRLRHLFREQLGTSIQRYILWQRLLLAIQSASKGMSLTEAAHNAGFADAAHLSRVFRMMFGIKPSEVFKDSHFVQVFSCDA